MTPFRRIVPALLMRDRQLYKGVRFGAHSYVGDPLNAVRIFSDKFVDELLLIDIGATTCGTGPDVEFVERLVSDCFLPVAYGGGVRSVEDAVALTSCGVEKVSLRLAAMRDMALLTRVSSALGRQSTVFALDVARRGDDVLVHVPGAPQHGSLDWLALAAEAVDRGAGEVVLTDVSREGTEQGLDTAIVRDLCSRLDVPVIVQGGVGSTADIAEGFRHGAQAVAVGSFFTFLGPKRAVLLTYPELDELAELRERERRP